MPTIWFENQAYETKPGETVLDGLERHGVSAPHSCRSGLCHTCMMRSLEGAPPREAQQGLKDSLVVQDFFLPCVCVPSGDMRVALPDTHAFQHETTVTGLDHLSPDIVRLRLARPEGYDYWAGQYLNVFNPAGVGRSYSLASVPVLDRALELHVRRVPGGMVSGWVHEHLKPGATISISDPMGDCFYVAGQPDKPLLLVGTGSGLAPLYGIARDALQQGHSGPIKLYHGASTPDGLYLVDELKALAARHAHFSYRPCVSRGPVPAWATQGRADAMALEENSSLSGWRVYLCGNPEMVNDARRSVFLAGASMFDILADPFLPSQP